MTREISKNISWYGQIGYYQPFIDEAPSIREAIDNYTADQYSAVYFTYYKFYWPDNKFDVQGNFGGKIGITSKWDITDSIQFTADIGYRMLSLRHSYEYSDPEELARDPNSQLCWGNDEDYGGYSIAIGVTGRF